MPIDAQLADEADLHRLMRVDDISADLQQARNLRVLLFEACRDNPLADDLKRAIGSTRGASVTRGLAKVESPEGTIVAYSTQAGRTAEDGSGRHSPYTAAFLRHVEEREEIGTIFRRVSTDVYESTHRAAAGTIIVADRPLLPELQASESRPCRNPRRAFLNAVPHGQIGRPGPLTPKPVTPSPGPTSDGCAAAEAHGKGPGNSGR